MNNYSQDIFGAHGLCYKSGPDESPRWWFDAGVLCEHPEWHAEAGGDSR